MVPKTFGGPPATDTCNCSLPTSMAAAVESSTGKEGLIIRFIVVSTQLSASPCPARIRKEQFSPAGISPRAGSPINTPVASRNQPFQRATRNRAHHIIMRSRCATLRTSSGDLAGSWSQCMRESETRLSMNRLTATQQRPPLPVPLLQWRRGRGPRRFMVAMQVSGTLELSLSP